MATKVTSAVDANRLMGVIKKAVRKWAHMRFGDEFAEEFVNDYVGFETWHHENGYMIFEVRGEWGYDDAYPLMYDYLNPAVEFFFGNNWYYFEPWTMNVLQLAIPDEIMGDERSAVGMSATRRNAYVFDDDIDEMLSVMDRARNAWVGSGWYRVNGSTEWCDFVSNLELCISVAYRTLDSYDDLVVEYLGDGEEPTFGVYLVVGSHGGNGIKKVAQDAVPTFEDISYFLSEAADACAGLEDHYFGEPVVDYLSKAYDYCEAAIDEIARASILVSE